MLQCREFTTAPTGNATTNTTTVHLSGKHGSSNKRQRRKLVSYKDGLVENILLLLVLFLFLSVHCIGLAHGGQVSPSSVTGLGKPSSSSSSSSGKDGGGSSSRSGGSGGSGAAMDDGELSSHHHPHHQHSYHRQHRHSSSGKNLVQPSPSSSVSTSASYGYQDYGPLSYYNSDAYVEPRHYDRPSREFSARSTSYPAMVAAASSSQAGFAETEYGGLALATGHGGGHTGHGHAGHGNADSGYGHGHHTTFYKTVNKLDQSSLGLLGLLGLLSLLSNVLMLLTTTARTTTMMMIARDLKTRPKRDTMMLVKVKEDEYGEDFSRRSVVERLSRLILPSLNVVGHAKDGRIPLNCTYQEVCKTNKALVQVFGADEGRPVASVLSTAITKLLANNNGGGRGTKNPLQGSGNHESGKTSRPLLLEKMLKEAGLAGRNGEDCELTYPTCRALSDTDDYSLNGIKKSGSFRLPYLVSPEHALSIIMGQSVG